MEKRMTEADGRALVELWQASGQRAATFCREQGIAAHRLSYWQQRVAELDGDGSERGFVEVTQCIETVTRRTAAPSIVIMAPGGWRIETTASLADVLAAVAERC
jgi:hypothetical protein